ncbi:MAG: hypothetical protein SFU25_01245 [Candidatus Caenarcaniphilales bacterium]|nr:hypothetical protein [Candidatus Caenarcaniphilales bacterium]
MSEAIKIVYSAFMALDESEKKAFLEYLEDQIESDTIYQFMQEGDQTQLSQIEMQKLKEDLRS